MTKFWTLVGLTFKQQFRVKTTTNDGKGKKTGTVILYIVLALIFVPVCVAIFLACLQFGAMTKEMNMSDERLVYVVGSLLVVAQGMTLLFGFSGVISNIFNCNDADKLLYLPTSARTIFFAKFFVTYVNEMFTSALMLICTVLPFGIGAGMGVGYYFILLLSFVLVPLLPMFVATIIAMPIALLQSKIGKNGVVRTIFNVLLYVVFMTAYIVFIQAMNKHSGDGDSTEDIFLFIQSVVDNMGVVVRYIHPDYLLAGAFVASTFAEGIGNACLGFAEYLLLFALLVLVARLFYGKLLATTVEGVGVSRKKKSNATLTVDKKGGVVRSLMISDFKRVARNPQLGFQAFAGMIIVPVIVVILSLCFTVEGDDGAVITLRQLASKFGTYFGVGLMSYLILLTGGTNVLGLYPLSRENKSLYLLKTLPVPFEKILLAKVMLANIVMLTVDVITAVISIFICGISPVSAILMSVGLFAYGFGNMCFTTRGDLKNPKLGWSNFQTGLKNAKNSWVAMLLGLLSAVLVVLTSAGFFVWYAASGAKYIEYIMWLAVDAVGALYAFVAYRVMTASAEKMFAEIEP